MGIKYIFPDFETFSQLDIRHTSTYNYAAHPSTRVLMCAFAFSDGPVEIWQEGDTGLDALKRDFKTHTIVPWHVAFEKMVARFVWKLNGLKWRDAMVDALYAGLPAGLKDCNRIPYFANEAETSKEKLLINKFCKAQKDGTVRNRDTDPEDWQAFCEYCKADVHDTRLIFQWLLERFDTPANILAEWEIDQAINERGMPIDRLLTVRAMDEATRLQEREYDRLKVLTGLDNPNSGAQLLRWLRDRGYPYTSLGKELVQKALKEEPDTEGLDLDD